MTTTQAAMNIIVKNQLSPPVRLSPIAEELGINLYGVNTWSNSISGMLKRDAQSKSGFSIYVNTQHPPVRQRFTIAHEIAHYILHREMIKEELADDALYRSGLSNSVEAEANKLAADILMPWHLINAAIDSGIATLPDLAIRFDVSQTAMAIRLGVPNES